MIVFNTCIVYKFITSRKRFDRLYIITTADLIIYLASSVINNSKLIGTNSELLISDDGSCIAVQTTCLFTC